MLPNGGGMMSEYDYSMFPSWRETAADAEAQEVLRLRTATETMTPRERFHAAMRFEEVDRLPTMVMGLWPETLERWRAEGMTSLAAEMVRFDAPLQKLLVVWPLSGANSGIQRGVVGRNR